MRLATLNLYAVRVFGDGGQIGSFFAAADGREQALAIGNQWAYERGFVIGRVEAKRHVDPRPVFTFSS